MDYDECGPQNPKDVQNYVSIILVMTILLVTNGILHAKIQRPENLIGQYAILHHTSPPRTQTLSNPLDLYSEYKW